MTISRTAALLGATMLAAAGLSACDQSPQSADGTTQEGNLGVAASVNGTVADTGRDTGEGADIGGAGEATAETDAEAPAP